MCKGIAEVYVEKRPVSPQAATASLEQVTLTEAPMDLPTTPRMLVPSDVAAQDADPAPAAAAVPKDAKKEVRLLILEYQHNLYFVLFHFPGMHFPGRALGFDYLYRCISFVCLFCSFVCIALFVYFIPC